MPATSSFLTTLSSLIASSFLDPCSGKQVAAHFQSALSLCGSFFLNKLSNAGNDLVCARCRNSATQELMPLDHLLRLPTETTLSGGFTLGRCVFLTTLTDLFILLLSWSTRSGGTVQRCD